jgi:hypothetical protein
MSIADNPNALAAYVEHLGGTPLEHSQFRFEIPLAETRRVIPEINKLGLRAKKVDERQGNDINGRACSYAIIELRRQTPETDNYSAERNLMRAIIR